MSEPRTVAEMFAVVGDSIPHHTLFRDLWSGRVVEIDDYPRYECPKCGRRLPVDRTGIGAPGYPIGRFTLTDAEVTMKCAVCGFDRKLAIPMSMEELDAGARALEERLDTQGWRDWHRALLVARSLRDPGRRAEAVGETLLIIRGALWWLHRHEDRSEVLRRLAVSSAVHWPHRV